MWLTLSSIHFLKENEKRLTTRTAKKKDSIPRNIQSLFSGRHLAEEKEIVTAGLLVADMKKETGHQSIQHVSQELTAQES